ncbi:MAG: HEPN domain-containing protein [Candidatus Cloacimonetes bacterium]|nr:HEPN domain-containing protein [Candidatus Cloacimonadota bacterium]
MINTDKQIDYWISSSENDFDTAQLLIDNNKIISGLFFCHLVIEKALKAHVVKNTKQIPPKSHNLIFLSDKTNLNIIEDDEIFFGILMKYQLQGRYPDYNPVIPDKSKANEYLIRTREILKWLKEQL